MTATMTLLPETISTSAKMAHTATMLATASLSWFIFSLTPFYLLQ